MQPKQQLKDMPMAFFSMPRRKHSVIFTLPVAVCGLLRVYFLVVNLYLGHTEKLVRLKAVTDMETVARGGA